VKVETGYVVNRNARLYYELAGEGQPIVLIHAGVADHRQWNHEFAHFAEDFQVLRYDLRGYGKSAPVEGEFSHLQDLVAILNYHAFSQPVVLIACSMGGNTAMDFALTEPARVKALVMVSSAPSNLALDVDLDPREADLEEAYEAGDLERVAELQVQIWLDGTGRTAQQVDPSLRAIVLEMGQLALSHDAKQLGKRVPDTDIPAGERLQDLTIPVLVVVGENDEPYSQAAADYMAEHLPFVRKVVMQNAGHLLNMEHPDLFQQIVREFLEEVGVTPLHSHA
jgi:pimeloyl-ACP methyl ester carboxylesterase